MPKLSLLFYTTLVLSLVIASDAKAFDPNHQVSHNRFLKKRAGPQIGGFSPQPVIGVGADPSTAITAAATQSTPTATTVDSTPVSSVTPSTSSSSATVTSVSTSQSLVSQVSSTTATTSLTSLSTSSSSSTSPTSTQSTSSTPPTIQTIQSSPSAIDATPAQAGSPTSQSVILVTNTASSSASATPSSLSSSSTGITHTALIVLIVIATSVGGSIIIWTIIRKWKFGKSSSFDDRMQPIDWQPSNDNDDNGGIPGLNRRNSTASSFHSGSGHAGIGATTLNPIPDHDFTPGPAHLAPVGGYADLARGPSPQPMMQELARGPSYKSDQYGVPLHHGGYATHGY
ncbi:hypothetical protein F4604DRAFT_1816024 [Suillus subluteus]|nr:hypothetical protein F4604DRAFT_1816024 [Suillus subluteus]